MNPIRLALSLLEVVISMSLFGLVMVAVLQSMVSTTNYVDFDNTRSDLTTAALDCQNRVINDFANTAWFYKWDPPAYRPWLDPKTQSRKVLFPSVTNKGTSIIFLKLRSALTVNPDPSKEQYGYINFRAPITTPVEFSHYLDSVPTPLMIMNPNYIADPQLFVAPVWEAYWTKPLNFDQNQDPANLRHYMYLVENNATGIPCLVRKYHNGYTGTAPISSLWSLDATLVEGVAEVQFATWREDPTLNENQVRIMVLLRHSSGSMDATGTTAERRIEIIAAMRSINQDT